MMLADRANKYVDEQQPWVLKKDPAKVSQLRDVCTVTLNLFRQLVVYLQPVLPQLAEQTSALLNNPIRSWQDAETPLTGTPVSSFQNLMNRIEDVQVQNMIEDSKPTVEPVASADAAIPAAVPRHPADTW
jgi:methionyl-tRNA synthetase